MNIDGIGQMEAKRYSASASSALRGLALDVIRRGAGVTAASRVPGRNSDQSFNGVGLPLLQLNHSRLAEDGGYWWWHTPDDTFDKIDEAVLKADTDLYADALARLLAEPVLPIDLVQELLALGDLITERQLGSEGRLNLDEAIIRYAILIEQARQVQRAVRSAGQAVWGRGLDLALLRILRPIHRVTYVPLTEHHPDAGVGWSPLPGLAPVTVLAEAEPGTDRYGFAEASLARERNRLLEALDRATREANLLLAQLEGR